MSSALCAEFEPYDDEYLYSEQEMLRQADRAAGRYTNRLIWEWCKKVDHDGSMSVSTVGLSNIIQRACFLRALQEIRIVGEFTVLKSTTETYLIAYLD